jgi:hypothetical protein
MTLTQTTDHTTEALANLLEQFKNSPKLAALLTSYVDQIQDLEDAIYGLLQGRWLDYAEGDQLDGLGSIVGENREGRTDSDYRLAIRVRILINLCEGTPEQIIEIFELLTGAVIELREYFPAALVVSVLSPIFGWVTRTATVIDRPSGFTVIDRLTGDTVIVDVADSADFASTLYNYLQTIKPAGVKANLVYWFSPDVFRFDSGPGWDQGHWAGAL